MSKKRLKLFLIDEQADFCDPNGSLYVPNADSSGKRLASFIKRHIAVINDIYMTLDSHHRIDVGHPGMWLDNKGKNPVVVDPKTGFPSPVIITYDDLVNNVWRPINPAWSKWFIEYSKILEESGRYAVIVYPPHCLIGRPGHCLYTPVEEAVSEWEIKRRAMIIPITKGTNIFTEHYSALKAEVEYPGDPLTSLNTVGLIEPLEEAAQNPDVILVFTGQALTHCVRFTIEDLINNFGQDSVKGLVFLEDTSDGIPGFEQQGQDFINWMYSKGVQTAKSTDYLV